MPVYKRYICLNCKYTVTKANTRGKFCSVKCQKNFEYTEWVKNYKNTETQSISMSRYLRRYIHEKYNHACAVCDIKEWMNKPITLQIDHVDGNYTNNSENNLILLCPNCHSQTETYGNKGNRKGKGRPYRQAIYLRTKEMI